MSENVPSWFIKKYEDTIYSLAQQRDRRVAGRTSGGGVFVGEQIYFPRMGAVEMYSSNRFAALALANAQMDMVSVISKPQFVAMGIWDPDKTKLNVNLAAEYGRATAMASMRAEDAMVISALNNAAVNGVTGTNHDGTTNVAQITTIGAYDAVMNLDTLAEAVAILGTNEKFMGEDLTFVQPFKVKTNNALDPYKVFSNVNDKDLPWNEINMTTYERLYDQNGNPITPATVGTTTGVDCYLFCRSAVSSDYNNEMTTIQERIGQSMTDMIGRWFQAGAVVKEAAGVIRIKTQYDFTVARQPLPVM